ncbi:MAG TPA: hypothetical protein DCY13_08850 [Verrucomicrobiales bacterium]|nr:hypothetical protein [Verrucomicrobiales bacterium]
MHIQFPGYDPIPILFEDRTVIAIDKPAGWMLIPYTWQRTNRNLQAAIDSSIAGGAFWAKSRNLKRLQHLHRLDAETTGILLLAKSQGALKGIGDLFEQRQMEKVYLAIVAGEPKQTEWTCDRPIGPVPKQFGRMQIDAKSGKPAETGFKLLESRAGRSLIECRPVTGRTHQIRIHLLDAGLPIVGDPLYGRPREKSPSRLHPMGLRSVKLAFRNPFTGRNVFVKAERSSFLEAFGFSSAEKAGAVNDADESSSAGAAATGAVNRAG